LTCKRSESSVSSRSPTSAIRAPVFSGGWAGMRMASFYLLWLTQKIENREIGRVFCAKLDRAHRQRCPGKLWQFFADLPTDR
jgi:hypothetical protein